MHRQQHPVTVEWRRAEVGQMYEVRVPFGERQHELLLDDSRCPPSLRAGEAADDEFVVRTERGGDGVAQSRRVRADPVAAVVRDEQDLHACVTASAHTASIRSWKRAVE